MKKQILILTISLSLVVAIGSISFGMSASRRKNAAKEEVGRLRIQMAQKRAAAPTPKVEPPLAIYLEPSVNTNSLAKLEAELTALRAELAVAKANQIPQRESWEERMTRMKEEEPEGYAEMIKSRTERREAVRYNLAKRIANFMELDTEFMTDAERENHELLIEKMSTVWNLIDQFNDPEQSNREAMRELFGVINEARPLMDAERSTMFRKLANDLGYDGKEAQDFYSYIEEIISATTIQPSRSRPRRRFDP